MQTGTNALHIWIIVGLDDIQLFDVALIQLICQKMCGIRTPQNIGSALIPCELHADNAAVLCGICPSKVLLSREGQTSLFAGGSIPQVQIVFFYKDLLLLIRGAYNGLRMRPALCGQCTGCSVVFITGIFVRERQDAVLKLAGGKRNHLFSEGGCNSSVIKQRCASTGLAVGQNKFGADLITLP